MTQQTPSLIDGAVGVVGSRIALVAQRGQAQIAEFEAEHPALQKIDCQGKLLMPGLINTHTHVSMTLQRGSGDDIELMPWLNEIVWPFEALQSDEDIEAGARLGIAEMLLGGTTTFVDMYWSEDYVASAAEELGIRALLGESCLDGKRSEIMEINLPKLVERVAKSELLRAAIAPHAPYTCSPELLQRCVQIAQQRDIPLIIHLAETLFEAQVIEERYNLTPTQYLDKYGIITPNTILAHAIHLSDDDIEIIKQRGAHIAHNPQCNMKLASGAAPTARLLERGVSLTIGTDGVCSNNDLDMWDEMRTAALLGKHSSQRATALSAYETLRLATVNGAAAIGLGGELGVIAPGALADIILVDTSKPHFRPRYDLISSLVYCGKAADVDTVMVHGKLLVESGKLLGVDLEAICMDVERRSAEIFAQL